MELHVKKYKEITLKRLGISAKFTFPLWQVNYHLLVIPGTDWKAKRDLCYFLLKNL